MAVQNIAVLTWRAYSSKVSSSKVFNAAGRLVHVLSLQLLDRFMVVI